MRSAAFFAADLRVAFTPDALWFSDKSVTPFTVSYSIYHSVSVRLLSTVRVR